MPAAMKRPATRSQPDEQPVLKRPAAATVPADDRAADPMAPLPENKDELEKVLADPNIKPLDKKLAKFKAAVKPDEDASAMFAKMKLFFEPSEMSCLWGRFGTLINGSAGEQQDAWKSICNMDWRSGKVEAKGKILAMQVMNPTRWKEFLVQESNSLTRRITKEVKKIRYYRGELIQKHGQQEFEELLAKGKFEEVEDSDGDTCYYKKELSQTDALELSRVATTGKQKTSSSQVEVEALASAFRSEFQGKGAGSSTDRKPLQNKSKKEKKEAKEETEDEKAQKSLKACLSAMNRHQEKLMVAISKLEKDRTAAGIRQLCVNVLQKVKRQQSNLQLLIADYNQKAAAKAIENVTKVSAECADALKKAKPFTS